MTEKKSPWGEVMREGRFGVLKVFILALGFVVVGRLVFGISQYIMRGHADDSISVIDIESALKAKDVDTNQGRALHKEVNEAYHYDFFALLDAPVEGKMLPDFEIEQNPAWKAKRRGIKPAEYKLSGNYAIQVAALSDQQAAQTIVRELHTQGYLAVIVSDYVNGKNVYRVRIDGGKQREQAESLQAAIARKTGLRGDVVTL